MGDRAEDSEEKMMIRAVEEWPSTRPLRLKSDRAPR